MQQVEYLIRNLFFLARHSLYLRVLYLIKYNNFDAKEVLTNYIMGHQT